MRIVQVALQHLVYVERLAKRVRAETTAREKAAAAARSERIAAGEAPPAGAHLSFNYLLQCILTQHALLHMCCAHPCILVQHLSSHSAFLLLHWCCTPSHLAGQLRETWRGVVLELLTPLRWLHAQYLLSRSCSQAENRCNAPEIGGHAR